jgi:RNA polymerase sigma factor FliA
MQVQTYEAHIEPNAERLILEQLYKSLDQRLGHPAGDEEICREMRVTLDEFHQILDRNKKIDLGSLQKLEPRDGNYKDGAKIKYIPDEANAESPYLFLEKEMTELLARAIEALPETERLVISLHYYDELTLKEIAEVLGISIAQVSQLRTKAILRLRSVLAV